MRSLHCSELCAPTHRARTKSARRSTLTRPAKSSFEYNGWSRAVSKTACKWVIRAVACGSARDRRMQPLCVRAWRQSVPTRVSTLTIPCRQLTATPAPPAERTSRHLVEQGTLDSYTDDGVFVFPYTSTHPSPGALTVLRKLGMFPVLKRQTVRVTEFTGVSCRCVHAAV
jgi:hypothetical protein